MTEESRCDRTARLLIARLDDVAGAAERVGAPETEVARLLELASIATLHAVELELLTTERAAAFWAEARARSPQLASLYAQAA